MTRLQQTESLTKISGVNEMPDAKQSRWEEDKSSDGIQTDSLDLNLESDDLLLVPTKCAESVKNAAKHMWHTLSHHELPAWLKDNEYLHHGHRPELPSFQACLDSCFRLHSETVNIWTHFVGR